MTDPIPPGKIRLSDARALLDDFLEDLHRSIMGAIDDAPDLAESERQAWENAVDAAVANAGKSFNRKFSNG